jgi:hypothetical protein
LVSGKSASRLQRRNTQIKFTLCQWRRAKSHENKVNIMKNSKGVIDTRNLL